MRQHPPDVHSFDAQASTITKDRVTTDGKRVEGEGGARRVQGMKGNAWKWHRGCRGRRRGRGEEGEDGKCKG